MTAAADVVREVVADLLPAAAMTWDADETEVTVRVFAGDELLCTAYVPPDATAREAVLHVGSVVQDAVIERLRRAVPACPGHEHPAALRTTDGGVAWCCPDGQDVLTAYAVPG